MKRSRIARKSSARKTKQAKAAEQWTDGVGQPFATLRQSPWLPEVPALWPAQRPLVDVDDGALVAAYRASKFLGPKCFICEQPIPGVFLEIHHIVPRARGGSDAWCNLIPLCRTSPAIAQDNPKAYPAVLWAKWHHDRANANWVVLTRLYGKWWAFDELRPMPELFG